MVSGIPIHPFSGSNIHFSFQFCSPHRRLSLCPQEGGGVSQHALGQTPLPLGQTAPLVRHPPGQTPPPPGQTPPLLVRHTFLVRHSPRADIPPRRPLQRMIRILLECILVKFETTQLFSSPANGMARIMFSFVCVSLSVCLFSVGCPTHRALAPVPSVQDLSPIIQGPTHQTYSDVFRRIQVGPQCTRTTPSGHV